MKGLYVARDAEQLAQVAAQAMFRQLQSMLTDGRRCHVVVPGGQTPQRCLDLLAASDLPWSRVHWYPSDERCVPVADPGRNDGMLRKALERALRGCPENFHSIPAELGCAAAIRAFEPTIKPVIAAGGFDLALLGLGEDGHTASLFPGRAIDDSAVLLGVKDAPKSPPERVSMGPSALRFAKHRWVLAMGTGKSGVLHGLMHGQEYPVSKLGIQRWYVDQPAARLL